MVKKENTLKNYLMFFKNNESRISTILGLIIIVVVGVLILNYFRGVNKEEITETTPTPTESGEVKLVPNEEGKLVPVGLPTTYTVETGDNLWKIAEKFYNSGYNWVDIAKENKLVNPEVVTVGENLTIPSVEVKIATKTIDTASGITGDTYTIEKGDNLWDIAVRAYGDGYKWVEVAKANDLTEPGLIHIGNTLNLPR